MGVVHGLPTGRCAGSGALPKNLLRASLLLLLKEQPGYGYDLVRRLKKLGVDDDSATVYRALRALEEEDAVASHWHTSSTGPARHVYRLTPAGEEQLHAAFEAALGTYLAIQQYFARYARAELRALDLDYRDSGEQTALNQAPREPEPSRWSVAP